MAFALPSCKKDNSTEKELENLLKELVVVDTKKGANGTVTLGSTVTLLDVEMDDGCVIRVRINNLHMEEDAGKTKNDGGRRLIDFNRSGVPLVEMVT